MSSFITIFLIMETFLCLPHDLLLNNNLADAVILPTDIPVKWPAFAYWTLIKCLLRRYDEKYTAWKELAEIAGYVAEAVSSLSLI